MASELNRKCGSICACSSCSRPAASSPCRRSRFDLGPVQRFGGAVEAVAVLAERGDQDGDDEEPVQGRARLRGVGAGVSQPQ